MARRAGRHRGGSAGAAAAAARRRCRRPARAVRGARSPRTGTAPRTHPKTPRNSAVRSSASRPVAVTTSSGSVWASAAATIDPRAGRADKFEFVGFVGHPRAQVGEVRGGQRQLDESRDRGLDMVGPRCGHDVPKSTFRGAVTGITVSSGARAPRILGPKSHAAAFRPAGVSTPPNFDAGSPDCFDQPGSQPHLFRPAGFHPADPTPGLTPPAFSASRPISTPGLPPRRNCTSRRPWCRYCA